MLPIPEIELSLFLTGIVLALAVFRVCRIIIEERITEPFREWVWDGFPPETTLIGYFLTCYWCMSFWIASLFVLAYILIPVVTLTIASILAISAIAGVVASHVDR